MFGCVFMDLGRIYLVVFEDEIRGLCVIVEYRVQFVVNVCGGMLFWQILIFKGLSNVDVVFLESLQVNLQMKSVIMQKFINVDEN